MPPKYPLAVAQGWQGGGFPRAMSLTEASPGDPRLNPIITTDRGSIDDSCRPSDPSDRLVLLTPSTSKAFNP